MLPPRIRVRVANAAFSRAFVLRRDAEALRIAPVLRELAPKLGADIDRFVNAANADERHAAGVFLFLRTPGMHAMLETPEDDFSYRVDNPDTEFDRLLHRNGGAGSICESRTGRSAKDRRSCSVSCIKATACRRHRSSPWRSVRRQTAR